MTFEPNPRQRPSYTVIQTPNAAALSSFNRQGSLGRSGSMRVSVRGSDMLEVQPDSQATLAELFLSGRSSQQNANVGATAEEMEDSLDVEMIPDPPCIAAYEEEDEVKGPTRLETKGTSPQEYWKGHAQWKVNDPAVDGDRARCRRFVEAWAKKNNISPEELKAPTTATELFSRKSRSRSRQALSLSRSGNNLEIFDGFVNIGLAPIGIRRISSTAPDQKTGETVAPGEPVCVDRLLEKDEVRFLRLADGRGWIFDQHDGQVLMAKMEDIEVGDSWYRVRCKELVDVRLTPCYDEFARTGRLLTTKELAVVNVKCRVRGQVFVHLADGRGWVFLSKPHSRRKDKSLSDAVMEECDAEVIHGDAFLGQNDFLPVTNDIVEVGLWTYSVSVDGLVALGTKLHGVSLKSGDILKIDKRCYAQGRVPEKGEKSVKWLRLLDGRGWVPEKTVDGRTAVTLKTGGGISYPTTLGNKFDQENKKLPSWALGIA